MTVPVLAIDLETYSLLDLRKTGAHRYAKDCGVSVLAWAIDNGPVLPWCPGDIVPQAIVDHVQAGHPVAAWNIQFDANVWNEQLVPKFGFPPLQDFQLRCTMARALYWGLPAALDTAARALGLTQLKDRAGHALMLQMCRPRAFHQDGKPRWWHNEDPAKYQRLIDYCVQDVVVERDVGARLPPLPDSEQRVWLLDYRANQRGVRIDRKLVIQMRRVVQEAKRVLDQDMNDVTAGAVKDTNKVGDLTRFIRPQQYGLGGVSRNELIALSKLPLPARHADAVRLRLDAARSSTSKLARMLDVMDPGDDRARGLIQYYGAGRTGRWAGRLVQPQNFPRGSIGKLVRLAIEMVLVGVSAEDIAMFFPDSPMGVIASLLRGCLVPTPGNLFVVVDLAQIEARVVAWLSGQTDVLDVFRAHDAGTGPDVYVFTAAQIGSNDRQMGKVIRLACGFGMGPPKFQATARLYGLELSIVEAGDAVYAYRDTNSHTVQYWWDCDATARWIAQPGRVSGDVRRVRNVVFERRGRSMFIRLPSGRELVYRNIGLDPDPNSRTGDCIAYDGVDQRTRQWARIRTYGGKLVENITQAVARDVMAEGIDALDRQGFPVLLSVHDEMIEDVPAADAQRALDATLATLRRTPAWAPGLPVNAEGKIMERYGK